VLRADPEAPRRILEDRRGGQVPVALVAGRPEAVRAQGVETARGAHPEGPLAVAEESVDALPRPRRIGEGAEALGSGRESGEEIEASRPDRAVAVLVNGVDDGAGEAFGDGRHTGGAEGVELPPPHRGDPDRAVGAAGGGPGARCLR